MPSVSTRRTGMNVADILTALPVRGLTQVDLVHLAHWVLGRGAQVVPSYSYSTGITLTTGGGTHLFRFRTRPRYQALERLWFLDLAAATNPATALVEIPSGATAVTLAGAGARRGQMILESLGSQSDAEGELTVEITPQTNSIIVRAISAWEVPRAALTTSTDDDGTEETRFNASQAMDETDFTNVADVLADPTKIGRRVSLFQWAVPATVGGSTSTAFALPMTNASYTPIWELPLPVLTRKLGRTAVTGTITGKLYAWVTAGTADIRFNSSVNGAGGAITINNGTPAWTAAFTHTVDCDDFASADGRQTSGAPAWDDLDIEVRKNGGGTCYVASASGWET